MFSLFARTEKLSFLQGGCFLYLCFMSEVETPLEPLGPTCSLTELHPPLVSLMWSHA